MKYYLVKLLTNTAGQDGSTVTVYANPVFNEETSYKKGDIVSYNEVLYKCKKAHTGEWNDEDFILTSENPAQNNALVAYHNTLAAFHNASDVLWAVVEIADEYGNITNKEIVNHKAETIEE